MFFFFQSQNLIWQGCCLVDSLKKDLILHNLYLFSYAASKLSFRLNTPPILAFNPFPKSRHRVLCNPPPLNFLDWTIPGWIVWCRVVSNSICESLLMKQKTTDHHSYPFQTIEIVNPCYVTSIKIGLCSRIAISRADRTALYTASASLPSTRILRTP